jgi:hypothetical protein
MDEILIKIKVVLASFVILFVPGSCSLFSEDTIVIENDHFRYEIDSNGKNIHFIDKNDGKDYLDKSTVSCCCYIMQDGERFDVTSAERDNDMVRFNFGESGVTASVDIRESDDHVTMEVMSVKGIVESFTFINIPLDLEGMPYEPFAACALSMNLFTQVRQLPALQTHLLATCYDRFGTNGAEVKIIGVPQQKILSVIRDVIKDAEDIPFSDKGGAWAQLQEEGYGSYLMNFGTLTEETVDEWISQCKSLGFNQIDNHGGGSFFRFGDFKLNPEKWPDGWDSFKRINSRLHEAGISSIFHSYAFFIDKNSEYVTPVPSDDLAYFTRFTVKEPVNAESTGIIVAESTADVSTITGFFVRNSRTLRIGDELIEFSGVTDKPPYMFTGCRRGVHGTESLNHDPGDKAFHLREMFGRFLPGPETGLFKEIARNTAEIINHCQFDGIYFDAIDGSDILAGEENFWYYGTKFIFEVAGNLDRPVGMEMSSMAHHWWHFRSRWQAWDRPTRGYKRFVDIHSAAIKSMNLFLPEDIKSNEYEHALWPGHAPLIDKYAAAENGGLLLPLHLGWWGNQTWNPPQTERTMPDDIEYLCCKMIGNNAGLSMLGGVDKETLEKIPLFARLIPVIRQYEELRHKKYFSDSVCALLREPGKEYKLFQDQDDKWNFKPVEYHKHKVEGIDHPSAEWNINNRFEKQPVKLRIESLMSVKPYNDPSGIELTGISEEEFKEVANARGVSGGILISDEKVNGLNSIKFSAFSDGSSPRKGSWIKMEKRFDNLNIEQNKGIGVWIKGDNKGEMLNIRLKSPSHISDGFKHHFIKIDFSGWKYFELVESESTEYSDYIWPDSIFYVYATYRQNILFSNVEELSFWFNDLPENEEVSCLISPVRALPLVTATIENPSVSINADKIVFPVRMESGMYLEFESVDECKLYGPDGEFIKDVPVEGNVPVISHGRNNVSFSFDENGQVSPRLRVTVMVEGDPL